MEAVFYVGKGKNARSLQHLKDARDRMHLPPTKVSQLAKTVLCVWAKLRDITKKIEELHISFTMYTHNIANYYFSLARFDVSCMILP